MLEFFCGWKRKAGSVTLLLACVLMGFWLRSGSTHDTFTIRLISTTDIKLISGSQKLVVWVQCVEGENSLLATFWTSEEANAEFLKLVFRFSNSTQVSSGIRNTNDFFSTGNGLLNSDQMKVSFTWFQFPFWSIVIPLALISASLLLSKPRAKPESSTTSGDKGA